jgi:hypothetical protein
MIPYVSTACCHDIYLLLNCYTRIHTYVDQISVVHHNIALFVCIVVGSGLFWAVLINIIRLGARTYTHCAPHNRLFFQLICHRSVLTC